MAHRALHVPSGTVVVVGTTDVDSYTDGLLRSEWRQNRPCRKGIFECLETDLHGRGFWLYPKQIDGRWWLSHFPGFGSGCSATYAPMSEQHLWQMDYIARAAEKAGYHVAVDKVMLPTKVKPDVLITGGQVTIGAEVQHTRQETPKVLARTTKAKKAGVLPIWAADHRPAWEYLVPHFQVNELPPGTRPLGTWTVTDGPKIVEAAKCQPGPDFNRCPVTQRNFCGLYHPVLRPWPDLRVDDVAELAPAGALVELKRRRRDLRRSDVFLVQPDHLKLYEELGGQTVDDERARTYESAPAPCTYVPRCENCGRPAKHGLSICEQCYRPDDPTCISCKATVPAGQDLCGRCAAAIAIGQKLCYKCATRVVSKRGVLCPECFESLDRNKLGARNSATTTREAEPA